MYSTDGDTADSPAVFSPVDTRLFSIPIIQYALYTLNDRIEGCIVKQGNEEAVVSSAWRRQSSTGAAL